MPDIVFLPDTHTYLVDGEPKLSVTQVLDANGMYPEFGKNEAAARFGTIGHKIVKMEIEGKLAGYDPEFEPYMVGIRKFIDEQEPVPKFMETMKYSEKGDFIGTVDFIGKLGSQHNPFGRVLLDWKFWSAVNKTIHALAGYQTAGYSRLFFGAVPVRRAVVHFYPEGYQILPCRDPLDSVAFSSLLNVAKLKKSLGLYKLPGIDEENYD
jgi:hypothetical protein